MLELTKENFEAEVLQATGKVFVDYYGDGDYNGKQSLRQKLARYVARLFLVNFLHSASSFYPLYLRRSNTLTVR